MGNSTSTPDVEQDVARLTFASRTVEIGFKPKPNFVNSIADSEMEAESLLLCALGKDYSDGVFKCLDPRALARIECTFT